MKIARAEGKDDDDRQTPRHKPPLPTRGEANLANDRPDSLARLLWLAVLLLNLWAVAAIYVDCRIAALRLPLAVIYVAVVIFAADQGEAWKALACLGCFCVVLVWWFTLQPTNEADWRADVARTAWADINGNQVEVHNVRNCDYRTETEFSNCWSDRSFDLSHLRGVDFFFVNWGIPWIGHPIVSFDFGNGQHLAFSIEARYKAGQTYSSVLGFFRQYELIFIAADERDVIRLRTNFRKDEEVYMYRTNIPPEIARKLFSHLRDPSQSAERPSGVVQRAHQELHDDP